MGEFQAMSPEEQQRVIQNYERWRQMTPEERQRLRERLRQRREFAPEEDAPRPFPAPGAPARPGPGG